MKTVEIVETATGQAIHLPEEFRFPGRTVSIRRDGDSVVLQATKPNQWPKHFFENIRIDDPTFVRPEQGPTPPAPRFD